MNLLSSNLRRAALPLLGLASLMVVPGLRGQNAAQLEVQEANTALQIAQAKVQDLEAKLARSKEQINNLGEGLAGATSEAKQAKENYDKLRLQLEGLGVAALNGSSAELQQRLLAALSDLRIMDQQKRQVTEALMNLSEAALVYAKGAPNAGEENKQLLNKSLSTAEKAVATAQSTHQDAGSEGDLRNAKVVSVKEQLGIAVLNVGSKQGVHPGMPITIFRQDKPIARAMVADVRTTICGAIIQDLVNDRDTVKVGDIGKVETSKS